MGIVGSPRQLEFDSIVSLAREAFGVPIALVSILSSHNQWFKASEGMNVCETERESAFCNYPVASGELFVVHDASTDRRFKNNRLVTGDPLIRFYAGVPLAVDPGIHIGTLCIMGTIPREFTAREAAQLRQMAEIVVALIRQFRDARENAFLANELQAQNDLNKSQAQSLIPTRSNRDSWPMRIG